MIDPIQPPREQPAMPEGGWPPPADEQELQQDQEAYVNGFDYCDGALGQRERSLVSETYQAAFARGMSHQINLQSSALLAAQAQAKKEYARDVRIANAPETVQKMAHQLDAMKFELNLTATARDTWMGIARKAAQDLNEARAQAKKDVDVFKAQSYRLRAEMVELLEALRLSAASFYSVRTKEARESCREYLAYILEQEKKARPSQGPEGSAE